MQATKSRRRKKTPSPELTEREYEEQFIKYQNEMRGQMLRAELSKHGDKMDLGDFILKGIEDQIGDQMNVLRDRTDVLEGRFDIAEGLAMMKAMECFNDVFLRMSQMEKKISSLTASDKRPKGKKSRKKSKKK